MNGYYLQWSAPFQGKIRKELHAYGGVGRRQLLVQLRLQSVDIVPDEGCWTEDGDGRFDRHCNQKRLSEMFGKQHQGIKVWFTGWR
jgi:hypothetical protein